MIRRPATRIELKMEDDLLEYEEFRERLLKDRSMQESQLSSSQIPNVSGIGRSYINHSHYSSSSGDGSFSF